MLLISASSSHAQGAAPVVAKIAEGVAPVAPANTARTVGATQWPVALEPDPAAAAAPVLGPARSSPMDGQLRRLVAQGAASGLAGVIYDNRDRGHSRLDPSDWPQVAFTRYAPTFVREGLDNGVAGRFRFPLPTLGNSSTAVTAGPLARSNARLALADQAEALRSFRLFETNHLYVYPEHRDHDPDRGDLLYSSSPLFLVSQGSSFSDRPFLDALLRALAAFPPSTRARLEETGLIAPTLQMVMRRTQLGVMSAEDYLAPAAHPPALRAEALRPGAMVAFANSLSADSIPPMVRLRMVQDFEARPGVDYLATNLGEQLFTTPIAIARLWRSYERRRTIRVSAADTEDPNGRSLVFRWVLLRGDPARVRITPAEPNGVEAQITLDWHDVFLADPRTGMTASRVDIAVFADNGVTVSAPAVVSVLFPVHQDRRYGPDGSGAERLIEIGYAAPADGDRYADPALWPMAPWRDRLSYDGSGRLDRIVRDRPEAPTEVFVATPTGLAAANATGAAGAPARHLAVRGPRGALLLERFDIGEGDATRNAQ